MTKGTLMATMGFILLSCLSIPGTAAERASNGWNATEVTAVVDDLRSCLVKMKGLETKMEQSRADLATKILGADGRRSANNEITMDGRYLNNYRADAWGDIGYLQDHWKGLSGSRKDLVGQAKIDLGHLE